eukprot:13657950-Ditylum_brightwellii.AAC.1
MVLESTFPKRSAMAPFACIALAKINMIQGGDAGASLGSKAQNSVSWQWVRWGISYGVSCLVVLSWPEQKKEGKEEQVKESPLFGIGDAVVVLHA